MTALLTDRTAEEAEIEGSLPAPLENPDGSGSEREDLEAPVRLSALVVAAMASMGAAAWSAGSLVQGFAPRVMALVGALVGVLIAAQAIRSRRSWLQYTALPVAAVVGAALVAPEAAGGTANLPGLVAEALRSGGLLQPPVPFDPGWRFILVTLFAAFGSAAVALPYALRRARLAVVIPVPLVFGAALLQPPGQELLVAGGALPLLVLSLAAAYGADLSKQTSLASGFEFRRLLRGGGILVVLVAAMVGLANTPLLFPDTARDQVIPPQKPPAAPLEADRRLFTVSSTLPGPWRIGVLDVYDGQNWLLPPVDPKRVAPFAPPASPTDKLVRSEFHVHDLRGRVLPVPAGLVAIEDGSVEPRRDPRVEVAQLDRRVPAGADYVALSKPTPSGRELAAAPPADATLVEAFSQAPPPPNTVISLLAQAPLQPFARLQFLRDRLYASVVAAGGGSPTAVPPNRVAAMFQKGAEATPFEIVAAEALLARWAGVPARIGYGYFGGERDRDGVTLHPKHGAAWLEAYFEGHGWVPLVGTPPRAKASLSNDDKVTNANVSATAELTLTVLVPQRRHTAMMLYEAIRYWMLVALPFVLAAVVVLGGYPVLVKALRSRRRRRWAAPRGAAARILVAYAEFRDRCADLNIGKRSDTALEFVARVDRDDEHEELGWLVTRSLWGDLRRDLRIEDAEVAEALARSVWGRVRVRQTMLNRALAMLTRTSVREPFSVEIPNARRLPRPRAVVTAARQTPLRAAAVAASVAVIGLAAGSGVVHVVGDDGAPARPVENVTLPARLAPAPPTTLGGFRFVREPSAEARYKAAGDDSLVAEGRVFTVRHGSVVQGSLQVVALDPVVRKATDVQTLVEDSLGGTFTTRRIGTYRVRVAQTPEQQVFLWFATDQRTMEIFVARAGFKQAESLVRQVLGFQRGLPEPLLRQLATSGPATAAPQGRVR